MTDIEPKRWKDRGTHENMNGAIYAVERRGRIDLQVRLSIGDERKVKRLLQKRGWADLQVTIEIKEDGL